VEGIFFLQFIINQRNDSVYSSDFDDDDDFINNLGAVSLQDVESRLIQLDPSIQDTMWYV